MKQSRHAKRMARTQRRHNGQGKLNLVSLMDIFTILVFFLLVNSSDVQVLQSNKDIKLPESNAETPPEENLIVTVSDDAILVGGRMVAETALVKLSKSDDITALKEELEFLAKRKPYRNEEEEKAGRDITIMGDKEIPYLLLKKIMTTCAQAEYRNISLAVSKIASDETAAAKEG